MVFYNNTIFVSTSPSIRGWRGIGGEVKKQIACINEENRTVCGICNQPINNKGRNLGVGCTLT